MLLVLAVQVWLVARTPVSSIDSVRFVSIAQSMESEGLLAVLHSDREQPLFPMVVCGAHRVLDSLGVDSTVAWMRSVQVASVLGLLLAVPAIYFVALQVAGRTAAWIGVMVLALLPEVARLGADGVADSWQWALVAWAVVLLGMEQRTEGRGQRTEKRGQMFLVSAGLLVALALLVRIEAVVVMGAVFLYIVSGGFKSLKPDLGLRQQTLIRARTFVKPGLNCSCFLLGISIVLIPYLLVCGTYQPSQAVDRLLGRAAAQETDRPIVNEIFGTPHQTARADITPIPFTEVQGLATFSAKEPGKSIRRRGWTAATLKVGEEVADLFGYWVGLFALVGVWVLQKRSPTALNRFAWILVGLLLTVMIWFTAQEGYVTARHLLLLLIPGVGCIGVGILTIGDWLGDWLGNRFKGIRFFALSPKLAMMAVVLLVMTFGLATPHRVNRSTYREAGCWLAQQSQTEVTAGTVFDTRGWTSLFSAMPTYQAERAKDAFADPRLEYVVVLEEELLSGSDRSHTLRALLDRGAKRVARFASPNARRPTDALVVYRCLKNIVGNAGTSRQSDSDSVVTVSNERRIL